MNPGGVYQVGDRFGEWTLLARLPTIGTTRWWRVQCSCGRVLRRMASNISAGRSQSCGSCGARRREERKREERESGRQAE